MRPPVAGAAAVLLALLAACAGGDPAGSNGPPGLVRREGVTRNRGVPVEAYTIRFRRAR